MEDDSLERSSSPIKWPLVMALAVPFAELAAQAIFPDEWQKAILVFPVVFASVCVAVFDLIGQEISDRLRTRVSVRNLLLFVASWSFVGAYGTVVGLVRGNAGFYIGADVYHWFIEILGVAIIYVWACYRYRPAVVASHLLCGFLLYALIGLGVTFAGIAGMPVAGGNLVSGSWLWRLDLSRGFPLIPLLFAVAVLVHPPKANAAMLKAIARLAIALLLVVLFFTLKRTQWALFPLGVLGIVLSKRLLAWSMIAIPCIAVLYTAIDVASPGTTTRWIDTLSELVTYNKDWRISDTLGVREEQTEDAYKQALQTPLGVGFGGELTTTDATGKQTIVVHYVHSLHAYYLMQLGPVGYSVLVLLTGGLLLSVFRALDHDPRKEWIARGSLMSMGILLASGFAMVSIHTCFAGMVVALSLMGLPVDDPEGDAHDEDDEDEDDEEEEDEEDDDDEDDEEEFEDDEDDYEEDEDED
jgi:hypothetical protein